MQTELMHRYSSGLTFESTWTWAHNLTDVTSFSGSGFVGEAGDRSLNRFDRRADWGEAGGTRRHRWTTTLLYELPTGKGRRFLGDAHGVVDGLFGGWQLSTIAMLQTGPFLTAWLPGDSSGTGTQIRNSGQRPDAFGNGNISNPTPSHYWNPDVFACPGDAQGTNNFDCPEDSPIGRFGNSRVGNLIGPGAINLSVGLAKKFRLTERASLRFESSFTNLPNHTNWGDPDTNLNSGGFGKVIVDRGGDNGGTRVGQFALRIEF
jgi:hypothetical protein